MRLLNDRKKWRCMPESARRWEQPQARLISLRRNPACPVCPSKSMVARFCVASSAMTSCSLALSIRRKERRSRASEERYTTCKLSAMNKPDSISRCPFSFNWEEEASTSSTTTKAATVPLQVARYPSLEVQELRAMRASCLFERVSMESSTSVPSISVICCCGKP